MKKVLLVNFAECPENLHLEQAFVAAAAGLPGIALDVLHDQDFHYSFIPQPSNRRGFRLGYTAAAAARAEAERYDAVIAADFPKRRRCAPFFCRLFAGGPARRAYFLANHLVPAPGHNFTADLFRRAGLLSRARLAWVLEYDDPSLWAELGLPASRLVERSYRTDTGYYRPGRRDGPGDYIFSAGSAGRDFAALASAAAGAGLPLRVRSDSPMPAGFLRKDRAWAPFSPNLGTLPDELRGSRLVVLPVADDFRNEAAGNSIAFMAMSCGRPVLTRDTPYMRRYIRNGVNGFLYGRLKGAGLREALRRAASFPEGRLRLIGRRARAVMLKKASLAGLAREVLAAAARG